MFLPAEMRSNSPPADPTLFEFKEKAGHPRTKRKCPTSSQEETHKGKASLSRKEERPNLRYTNRPARVPITGHESLHPLMASHMNATFSWFIQGKPEE